MSVTSSSDPVARRDALATRLFEATLGLIEQGVAQGYDVILIQSVDSASVAAPLAEAKEAGIPVIELTTSDPQLPSAEAAERGVYGYTTTCYTCAGRQMAAYVVADGGENASAAIYNPLDVQTEGPVFVHDRGPAARDRLRSAYGDRTVWVIDGPTRTGSGYRVVAGPLTWSRFLEANESR